MHARTAARTSMFPALLQLSLSLVVTANYRDLWRCPQHLQNYKHGAAYVRVFRDKCYEFQFEHETYWSEAKQYCANAGRNTQDNIDPHGRLVEIFNQETQDMLASALHGLPFGDDYVWIGANDRRDDKHWEWSSGLPMNFTAWQPGEPDKGLLGSWQDCGTMYRHADWRWKDRQCSLIGLKYRSICQYDMNHQLSSTSTTQPEVTSELTDEGLERQQDEVVDSGSSHVRISKGALAGAVVGAFLLFLLIVILLLALLLRGRRRGKQSADTQTAAAHSGLGQQNNPIFYQQQEENISFSNNVYSGVGVGASYDPDDPRWQYPEKSPQPVLSPDVVTPAVEEDARYRDLVAAASVTASDGAASSSQNQFHRKY